MKRVSDEQLVVLSGRRNPFQPLETARLTEPRIDLVHARLRALLRVVQLESGGVPVEIDGFRLRDPGQWRSRVGSPLSELWHISTACNMRCPFCYEEGDPVGSSVLNEPAEMATVEEIEARLRYRDPATGTGVFQPLTYINEIFCNPQAMTIMERLRAQAPDEVLTFVTNGTYLTRDNVRRIAAMKPVFFNFSVNSLDPTVRRKILRDNHPSVAIEAIELLREYDIPYLGSLVCWPTIPWSDIENTVLGLDAAGCAIIRYSLSAYSKHLKGVRHDREAFWGEAVAVAQRLMHQIATPLKVEPYHLLDPTYLPNVAGVVKGSPAARSGVRAGDRVLQVDGRRVATVNQALSALSRAARAGRRVALRLRRELGGEEFEVELDDDRDDLGYPYTPMRGMRGFEWGLILIENLRFSYFQELRAKINERGARRILICSSMLMKPIVLSMIHESGAFTGCEIDVQVPPNRFFGGTVMLGDLLVVDDYVEFLREYVARAPAPPDLVVIPSSPFSRGDWLRDLAGVPFTEIERRTGVAVELIYCRPLNG